ncbi:small heat shock protein [Pholiota conissans]|uniref:Small heat shock protein n=1 Tax=Pholiota conissans TaxID=109636 RepID=A0A9P5ZA44_9AGAR|nr:small heat shock protein [Pholiota conissans]
MASVFFYEPYYDIERLVNQAFAPRDTQSTFQRQQNLVDGAVRSLKPRMDLHENDEQNVVTATFEFPGVSKDNIQIDVHNGRLTVSAETKEAEDVNESEYAVRERRFGKYSRTLQLPQGVKDEEIKASMENGVLNITFPKTTAEQAPKRITIS